MSDSKLNFSSNGLFTLSVAAEIIGVHPRTLIIYEKEGLVVPHRTKTNRRRFSKQDIRRLQFVRFLTHERRVNLAGVESILSLVDLAEKKGFNLRKTVFADFVVKNPL